MSVSQINPIYMINKRYNSLSKTEKRVAEYIQRHMDEAVVLTLQGLAKKCDTSDATVLRFCRSLGYMGFADFKISLVPELLRSGKKVYLDVDKKDGAGDIKEGLKQNFINQAESTLNNCDIKILSLLASKISKANKVMIIGLGGSAGVAQIFCDSLSSLCIFSSFLQDRSIIQNVVPMLKLNDVLVGISHSGETEEIISAIKTAREYGAITIGITNFLPSGLADAAQFPLLTVVPSNLLGSYSCQARISQLIILEMILFEISKLLKSEHSKSNLKQNKSLVISNN
jgi:DNA-binding MurR/RpiR family transcriptional regulator